jgi:hypothetical protein
VSSALTWFLAGIGVVLLGDGVAGLLQQRVLGVTALLQKRFHTHETPDWRPVGWANVLIGSSALLSHAPRLAGAPPRLLHVTSLLALVLLAIAIPAFWRALHPKAITNLERVNSSQSP